jgi:hypothetical protein
VINVCLGVDPDKTVPASSGWGSHRSGRAFAGGGSARRRRRSGTC